MVSPSSCRTSAAAVGGPAPRAAESTSAAASPWPAPTPACRRREGAKQLGIRRATVSLWETGEREPGAVDLLRLAESCGVELDALCGRVGLPAPRIIRGEAFCSE